MSRSGRRAKENTYSMNMTKNKLKKRKYEVIQAKQILEDKIIYSICIEGFPGNPNYD
jgi:hypothetical protein